MTSIELSDSAWSVIMVALRYKAGHDQMRAMDCDNNKRLAAQFKAQALASNGLANQIEKAY